MSQSQMPSLTCDTINDIRASLADSRASAWLRACKKSLNAVLAVRISSEPVTGTGSACMPGSMCWADCCMACVRSPSGRNTCCAKKRKAGRHTVSSKAVMTSSQLRMVSIGA